MNENKNSLAGEIKYDDNVKRYDLSKPPVKQTKNVQRLTKLTSKALLPLIRKGHTIEKINMEGLEPPYILLANHMQFMDFPILFEAIHPHKMNLVAANHVYYKDYALLEKLGCMCTRKFTADLSLVRNCHTVLQDYGDVFAMFPEARYSPDGTQSVLPAAIGKLAKKNKVPVVVLLNHGNFLNQPFWSHYKFRKVPFYATMKQILTAEDVEKLSVDEINEVINEEFQYDDYKWQKDNNIRITEKYRADGIHRILYQCPNCMTEGKMTSSGICLSCKECGKKWEMTELGEMKALEGETEFSHVPDWYKWQRENVRKEILNGTYSYKDEVPVYGFPGVYKYIKLGKAKVSHDFQNGFVLTGHYNGHAYRIHKPVKSLYSLHIEYQFSHLKGVDCFELPTKQDSIYCIPTNSYIITKLALATEEAYKIANENGRD
ncbi:MAG: hypothetical protein IJZ16_01800 [Clostridia bacterium]|nr:hypothetical protein [Clostridia bacterium]